ncbi:type VII secretion-associated serine protease mycosin [Streptomyces sp. RFCAC02]|uniref:type VII secretion-associated serine protease mycosin n=1 Tax=Streptomyces sp. RFCAC02 TaxID=2499143 RepID=UPI00101F6D40|nr:type VII secretion-associated serine protease mycosin [Streptomyces sp. RFCAC02]
MTGQPRRPQRTAAAIALALLAAVVPTGVQEARADGGTCTFPAEPIAERPWSLQRVQLDRLWAVSRGAGVRVAVIDTGVDATNPQLAGAVAADLGADVLPPEAGAEGGPTVDPVGHGTKVAGIIAAREADDSGFTGLAPDATIIPIRQNDGEGGGTVAGLIEGIAHAVAAGADVINISQDVDQVLTDDSALAAAVQAAIDAGAVVVASVGNEGADGRERRTYPAASPGVLAVAASDRNNERAPFSQAGDFVDIAAPGVDMVSTVPGGGQCVDNGTSFAAPYVAGVAALLCAARPDWTPQQVIAQLQQTAERPGPGPDDAIGWGVVDPVRALTELPAEPAATTPTPDAGPPAPPAPDVPDLQLTETHAERAGRRATYAVLATAVLTAVLAGVLVVRRDRRRR